MKSSKYPDLKVVATSKPKPISTKNIKYDKAKIKKAEKLVDSFLKTIELSCCKMHLIEKSKEFLKKEKLKTSKEFEYVLVRRWITNGT